MTRLDQALVERGLCESRERAILAGQVRVNAQSARKPSDSVKPAKEARERKRGQSSLLTQNTTQWLPLNGFRLGVGLGSERDCIRLCKFWDWQMVNFLSINPCRLDFRIAGGRIQRKFEFIST